MCRCHGVLGYLDEELQLAGLGGAFGSEELGDYGGILKEMAVGNKGRTAVIRVYELLAEEARR